MTGFICYPEYPEADDPDYDLTEDWDDEEDEESFDCGFVPDEGCLLGGSEQCDFECPYRDDLEADLNFRPHPKLSGY